MALIETRASDISGEPISGVPPVILAVGTGTDVEFYIIDLTTNEIGELHSALARFTEVATSIGVKQWTRIANPSKPRRTATAAVSEEMAERRAARQWGRGNGWPNVSDSGAMPSGLLEAYRAAHSGASDAPEDCSACEPEPVAEPVVATPKRGRSKNA